MIAMLAAAILAAPVAPAILVRAAPSTSIAGNPIARLSGFAARLSEEPPITGPGSWQVIPSDAAWSALAAALPADRQNVRWRYARSLIGLSRGQEALGVLATMKQADPDLAMVASFQLAIGAALVLSGRNVEAVTALAAPGLAGNSEACALRVRALAATGAGAAALEPMECALPSLNARPAAARRPFLLAAAHATLTAGQPSAVAAWLSILPKTDAAANLYRGRALLALGDPGARPLLEQVRQAGEPEERVNAEMSLIEASIGNNLVPAPAVLARLDHVRYTWRGDMLERRALLLSYRIGMAANDINRTLSSGAALFRYFDLGTDMAPLSIALQTTIGTVIAPGATMPIDQAAGLYWEYRDLAPSGTAGDFLVNQLADRLQLAGLYERAGNLLRYQLIQRIQDIEQGPLSVKVATLYILAGLPKAALAAIRDTDGNVYPAQMQWARHRVEAVALQKLGLTAEAMAVLQDVPDGRAIRDEIYWVRRDWAAIAATDPSISTSQPMTEVDQAIILRHAIALAMLGQNYALTELRTRFGDAFAGLATAAAFDLLTGDIGTLDPDTVSRALAAIPSASPAGDIASLLSSPVKKVQA